jgi:hypothetical protein
MRIDWAAALVAALCISACSAVGLPISGRVVAVDATHGPDDPLPVEDAVVVAFTTTKLMSIGHPGDACLHIDVARTDARGAYGMPGWLRPPIPWITFSPGLAVFVYKAGYVTRSDIDDGHRSSFDVYLAPDVEPDLAARLREIDSLLGRCSDVSPNAHARLASFLDVEGARLTARTPEEREAIRRLRSRLRRQSEQ